MKYLKWSDNGCTVGWTTIHAHMNHADKALLLTMAPEGRFSKTFYYAPNADDPEAELPFYFDFKLPNTPLLVALKLLGMTGERYMSKKWPNGYALDAF